MPDDVTTPPLPPPPPAPAEADGDGPPALNIADELKDSYLTYAMSVIISRALPDVRDGLKPSQRRILVAMNDLHLGPNASTSKCAGIVGETMKRYHPHGEATIYPTLVRMAQDWNMRYRLVHSQGNFGSQAGLPPAAMRYCVTGETLVRTLAGTRRIDELAPAAPNSDVDLFLEVYNRDGQPVVASKLFHSGDHPTLRLRTTEGFEITGTHNHPLLCLEAVDGVPTLRWRLLGEIRAGERVCLARNTVAEPDVEPVGHERRVALLAGAFVSEGFVSEKRAGFNNTDRDFFDAVVAAYDVCVGGTRYLTARGLPSGKTLYELDVHNLTALRASPLAELAGLRSAEKRIPSFIWGGSGAVKRVFLQSLYEGDGSSSLLTRSTISIAYSTRSQTLAREVQVLLLEFGIVSRQARYASGEIKVYISNRRDARLFSRRVGFLGAKQGKLIRELMRIPAASRAVSSDHVPALAGYVRSQSGSRWVDRDWLNRHNIDRIERWEREGDAILARIGNSAVRATAHDLVAKGYYYAEVESVTDAGVRPVYSLRVESECHSFITNGFVSHNTEARLTPISAEMLADLESDTVDFIDNYDGKYREPLVLPSKFPSLLVNGSDGIAVGMATDIPPHNLREVCDALIRLIDNPALTVLQLMQDDAATGLRGIPGPDFPTGGVIHGRQGILDGYSTGRGKVTLRARADIVEEGRDTMIVIREVPYQETRNRVAEEIGNLVKEDRLKGVKEIRDESSARKGEPVRIVLYLKRDADPHLILNQLYQYSRLEKTASIILLALVDGRPRTLSLKQMLEEFLRHRREVVRRRTEFQLREAKRRAHVLEGQLIAVSSLEEVIHICRSADSRDDAKVRLQGLAVAAAVLARALGEDNFQALVGELGAVDVYHMTEAQAEAVVRMQLGQLARLQRDEIVKEYADLRDHVRSYERLLGSEQNILAVIRQDLEQLRDRYGDDRRTEITGEAARLTIDELIPEEEQAVTLSHHGYIKRLHLNTYRSQRRGGRGVSGGATREDDWIEHFFVASTHAYLLCFTNRGQLYWLRVYDIPEQSRTATGRAIANVLELKPDERITSIIPVRDLNAERSDAAGLHLLMATRRGLVKKTALSQYCRPRAGGLIGIHLDDGDTLIHVALVRPADEVLLCTRNGMAIRFDESGARPMGRDTRGVKGIHLRGEDEVVGMVVADPDGYLLTVCANGYGKRTPFGANTAGPAADEAEEEAEAPPAADGAEEGAAETSSAMHYRKQRRGGKGIRDVRITDKNGPVVGVASVRDGDDVMLITTGGMVTRSPVNTIRIVGRNTQGVRLMNLHEGDKIASLARVVVEADEEAAEEPTA